MNTVILLKAQSLHYKYLGVSKEIQAQKNLYLSHAAYWTALMRINRHIGCAQSIILRAILN